MRHTTVRAFQKKVYAHYRTHGRIFPWRKTRDPYKILVSEVMLQQTQVERVVPKYREFLKLFPTVRALARAPRRDVLKVWQGLGYNRRARALHECARSVVEKHNGNIPKTRIELEALPSVGTYTAGAILAFAYNIPTPIIETNIRTVYLRHFMQKKTKVHDKDILKYVEQTMDLENSRLWYAALMDYGSYLKKKHGNENVRSAHYTQQKPFRGSSREARGAIIRALSRSGRFLSTEKLRAALDRDIEKKLFTTQLTSLLKEGLVEKRGRGYALAN